MWSNKGTLTSIKWGIGINEDPLCSGRDMLGIQRHCFEPPLLGEFSRILSSLTPMCQAGCMEDHKRIYCMAQACFNKEPAWIGMLGDEDGFA